jgi:hypothetical protein
MRLLEFDRNWTFTSTGAGGWQDAYTADNVTFYVETAPGSTATVVLEHRRQGSSLTVAFATAINLSQAASTSQAYSGAYYQVRARVSDMTSTGTVYVQAVGN